MINFILKNNKETIRYIVVIASVSILCILTYYFEIIIKIHTIYSHLFYFPIILACYWWKKKGLIIPLFLSGILIFFSFLAGGTNIVMIEEFERCIIFTIVGFIISILSQNVSKNEQNLRESEEKYRLIFENANDAISIHDLEGNFHEVNDQYCLRLGYTREEILKLNIRDFVTPEYAELVSNRIFDIKKTGFSIFETAHVAKDGRIIPVEISAKNILYDNKSSIISIIRDITDRKKAERELQLERDNLINIFSSMEDGVYIVDQNYDIKYVNPILVKEFGQYEDKKCHEYLHGRQDVCTWCKIPEVFKGKTVRWELDSIRNQKIYDNIDTPLKNFDGSLSKLKIIRDITMLKKVEQKLRESETKFRHLFETAPLFIGLLNTEGILIDCNDTINDVLSVHSIEDVKGKNIKEIFSLNEKNTHIIPIFEKMIKNIFGGVNQEGFDFRLNRTIGGYFWLHFEGTLIEIENQEMIQFILQDITERKRSEQLLQKSIEELARSNTELEQFTYFASHDLKEPLRMISSFAQLLEKRYTDKLDEDGNDFIRFITEGAVRMQDLINSLLTYSRIGESYEDIEKINLNDILKDVINNLKPLIQETHAEVIYDSLPSLSANKHQLLQVFQNLISNAIKFRGTAPPLITISARPERTHWVFSIHDNGIGIDSKDFERIFIIFKRLHTIEKYEGTGIGLSICKKIIETFGGKIWVESEVGRGSTFYFSIPKENGIKG